MKQTVGYEGDVVFNSTIPDGTPRKLVDVSKINALGWKARIPLAEGVQKLYLTFQKEFLVKQ
ncbi:GDP-L-fucose synthase [compost metagenome]